jgi:hypothetical protein
MAPLLQLPLELLLEVQDYLPPDAILSLKLSHPILNSAFPPLSRLRTKTLTNCARFAIERYRARHEESPSHLRCILCKGIYPANMFASSSSPACLPVSFVNSVSRPEVVELPPLYCAWHVGRLARVVRTGLGGRNEWVSDVKRMCMHNGCIQGWGDCGCDCDSCGYQTIRTYTRYLNNNTECKRFQFWRNIAAGESEDPLEKARGRLYMRETCWDGELFVSVHVEIELQWRML